MIMEHVWDYNFDPQTNVVEARISRLRDKIDRDADQKLIHTVRGRDMSLKKPGRFRNRLSFPPDPVVRRHLHGLLLLSPSFLFYTLITSVIQERTDQELLNQAGNFSTVLQERGSERLKTSAFLEAQGGRGRKVFFRLSHPTGQAFSSSNMSYWKDIAIRKKAIEQLLGGAKRNLRNRHPASPQ